MIICAKWCIYLQGEERCTSPHAPSTDPVTGLKDPRVINKDGKCPYYVDRRNCEVKAVELAEYFKNLNGDLDDND